MILSASVKVGSRLEVIAQEMHAELLAASVLQVTGNHLTPEFSIRIECSSQYGMGCAAQCIFISPHQVVIGL